MFASFSKFRRSTLCSEINNKRELEERQQLQIQGAELLGDLLLNNCSVAIQDVFEEDSIPLPASVLSSLSSAAVVLKATPPPNDPTNPRPATKSVGTLTVAPGTMEADETATGAARATSTGRSGGSATSSGSRSGSTGSTGGTGSTGTTSNDAASSSGAMLGAAAFGFVAWVVGLLIL